MLTADAACFVPRRGGLSRGEIQGSHIMGEQATELMGEMNPACRVGATTEERSCTMRAHPTIHAAIHEATLASEGRVIHG